MRLVSCLQRPSREGYGPPHFAFPEALSIWPAASSIGDFDYDVLMAGSRWPLQPSKRLADKNDTLGDDFVATAARRALLAWRRPRRARFLARGRDERGFWDRAGDEIAYWFGDDDAERRRRHEQPDARTRPHDRDEDDVERPLPLAQPLRPRPRAGRDFHYDAGFDRGGRASAT